MLLSRSEWELTVRDRPCDPCKQFVGRHASHNTRQTPHLQHQRSSVRLQPLQHFADHNSFVISATKSETEYQCAAEEVRASTVSAARRRWPSACITNASVDENYCLFSIKTNVSSIPKPVDGLQRPAQLLGQLVHVEQVLGLGGGRSEQDNCEVISFVCD